MTILLKLAVGVFVALATFWSCAAIWIDGPESDAIAGAMAASLVLLTIVAFALLRPRIKAFGVWLLGLAVVLFWWLELPASNQRAWLPDVAELPTAEFHGDLVTIRNVRNFEYTSESDYVARWEDRTIDLAKIRGVDLFLSYWSSPYIAHTIASWDIEGDRPLAISIETRKERGETYSAVLGFFRRFELYYVVADERDLVGLRTNFRGEEVYLYRMAMAPEYARALLVDYLEDVNSIARQPRWYNALSHNCTTMIQHHAMHVLPDSHWDWRILVNGLIDQMGYERGSINTSLPFEELRKRSNVVARANAAGISPEFSSRIREGLPARPVQRRP